MDMARTLKKLGAQNTGAGRNSSMDSFVNKSAPNSFEGLEDIERNQVFLRGYRPEPTINEKREEADHWWNDIVGIHTGGRSVVFSD